jgi:trk system potassium uptake protein TrkH
MKLESSLHYLGIILQFNGIILIFPTIVALIYNENFGIFSLTALISFIIGFIFSNFFKKKELDTISAYLLIFLAFIFRLYYDWFNLNKQRRIFAQIFNILS